MALEVEFETFRRELPRLIADSQGKFALMHSQKVEGIFDTYEDALQAGYEKFRLEPFMVKRIDPLERVQHFSRDIALCRK